MKIWIYASDKKLKSKLNCTHQKWIFISVIVLHSFSLFVVFLLVYSFVDVLFHFSFCSPLHICFLYVLFSLLLLILFLHNLSFGSVSLPLFLNELSASPIRGTMTDVVLISDSFQFFFCPEQIIRAEQLSFQSNFFLAEWKEISLQKMLNQKWNDFVHTVNI